jgi:hypothetical protein
MDRRLALAAAFLALIIGVAACRPANGGAGGSPAATQSVAPGAPTDAPQATPTASTGYAY